MFKKRMYVMHKSEGVCQIEDIRAERFGGVSRQYYILRPVYENTSTTVFLPLESAEKRLRALIAKAEGERLLAKAQTQVAAWETNDRVRQEQFHQVLRDCDTLALLTLVYQLRDQRAQLAEQGKKLRFFDEHTLQECERLLSEEFAYVWGVDKPRALSGIHRKEPSTI